MTKNFGLTVALAVCCGASQNVWGQPAASGPRIGFVLSHDQELRPLYGLPSNVMLGGPRYEGAGEAAFSDSAGLVRVGSRVLLQAVGSNFSLTTIGTLALENESELVLGMSGGWRQYDGHSAGTCGHLAALKECSRLVEWRGIRTDCR
jgi:hypothetical protein